ncbi:MAG: hypothetical protein A2268_04285 [Candidatus Raymondbacteria bacterium RifOxyA12_full_50_37]|uniref:Uncharacterized protein n=1 Tax=Candidatus Raymondbacteria bacterium RIFOXYD12_FULL_49_13 TaxID=1817890 RepID=A0A1F7FBG4_UNCRA|nr:MAG: hypothetical protein A2268_04285 [Candidatus Raymondbacteria bacterium RifOxyA12_full_50_37]OGJ92270.1 MAG: hypothetical protein A2350_14790 [Candidatus Raymondbacteria bacterium RifOxyB12_full_50_8]OGJ92558.1 MAG: hypothetical protein A2248_05665 [Candidatus Raymondbacteria bacterium RIFOXYA2_FULL_49_16]OGJ97912.1 MAG: hypothetical protein A2453_02690 [Candidatus Raymondbacteria bacterium RIFOXYC2_FULL_50_21]OGK03973.1 MAG: hypothetical protein A2519_04595 [Candidatus Raymondbacteria b
MRNKLLSIAIFNALLFAQSTLPNKVDFEYAAIDKNNNIVTILCQNCQSTDIQMFSKGDDYQRLYWENGAPFYFNGAISNPYDQHTMNSESEVRAYVSSKLQSWSNATGGCLGVANLEVASTVNTFQPSDGQNTWFFHTLSSTSIFFTVGFRFDYYGTTTPGLIREADLIFNEYRVGNDVFGQSTSSLLHGKIRPFGYASDYSITWWANTSAGVDQPTTQIDDVLKKIYINVGCAAVHAIGRWLALGSSQYSANNGYPSAPILRPDQNWVVDQNNQFFNWSPKNQDVQHFNFFYTCITTSIYSQEDRK